jgi:hypothetical protein
LPGFCLPIGPLFEQATKINPAHRSGRQVHSTTLPTRLGRLKVPRSRDGSVTRFRKQVVAVQRCRTAAGTRPSAGTPRRTA